MKILALFVVLALVSLAYAQSTEHEYLNSNESASATDFSGFGANVYFDDFRWCYGEPSGNSCEDWRSSCGPVNEVSLGQKYYGYLEVKDLRNRSGWFSYAFLAYGTPPRGSEFNFFGVNDQGQQLGGYRCWKMSFKINSPAGFWRHRFFVTDYLDGSTQSFPADLMVKCTQDYQCVTGYTCQNNYCTGKPDYIVEDISTLPNPPRASETTILQAVVKNIGKANAPPFHALFTLNGQNPVEENQPTAFQEQEYITVKNWRNNVGPGSNSVSVTADSRNEVNEYIENNNNLTRSFTWAPDSPDLRVENVQITPSSPYSDRPFGIYFEIREKSNKAVAGYFNGSVAIDGRVLDKFIVPGIGAGAYVHAELKNYALLALGAHTLRVRVDENNSIPEDNESNEFNFTFTVVSPGPVTQALTGFKQEYYKGDLIVFSVLVRDALARPIQGADVSILDPFTARASVLKTGSDGIVVYSTNATSTGAKTFEIYSSKSSYQTKRQSFQAKVLDYNGRVIVSVVSTYSKKPIFGARVWLSNKLYLTDAQGAANVPTDRGVQALKVECPDASPCSEEYLFVSSSPALKKTCSCNYDSDGDFMDDEMEVLAGTDPNNAASNLGVAFASPDSAVACLRLPPLLRVSSINESVRAALLKASEGVSSQQAMALEAQDVNESRRLVIAAGVDPNSAQYYSGPSLQKAYRESLNFTVVTSGRGAFVGTSGPGDFLMYSISPRCVGTFLGAYKGAGYGLSGDFDFARTLVNAITFAVGNPGKITEKFGEIQALLSAVLNALSTLVGNSFTLLAQALRFILTEGKQTATDLELPYGGQDYSYYQTGFTGGYVVGYAGEQVVSQLLQAALTSGASFGTLFAKIGAAPLVAGVTKQAWIEALGKIAGKAALIIKESEFLSGVGQKLSPLGQAGLGVIAKYSDNVAQAENYVKALDEGIREVYLARLGKVAEKAGDQAAFKLANSKVGQTALREWTSENAHAGLARIIWETGDTTTERLSKEFGKDTLEKVSEAASRDLFKTSNLPPRKVGELFKIAKRAGYEDLVKAGGEQQIAYVFDATKTQISVEYSGFRVPNVGVLPKGVNGAGGWGYEHIFTYIRPGDTTTRAQQIMQAFGLPNDKEAVVDLIGQAFSKGNTNQLGDVVFTNGEKTIKLVIGTDSDKKGKIVTALLERFQ